MEHRRTTPRFARAFTLMAAVGLAVACSSGHSPGGPETNTRAFVNMGFETGAAGAAPPGWTIAPFLNKGITVQTPQTYAGLDFTAGGKALTTIIYSATGPLTQQDPDLAPGGTNFRWPRYGNQCARVNFHSSTNFGNGQNINVMSQTMTVGPADVDPTDGQVHVRFVVAPVLQNPAHIASQQPYYMVQLTDLTAGNTLLYSDFNLSGAAGVAWQSINTGTVNEIDFTDWQLVDIAPVGNTLAMGDMVELQLIASGCSPGGHFGELYVDGGAGASLPGLFVFGTAPSQVNACDDLTYKLTYENGAATAAAGVVVTFNTPPNTTFVSDAVGGLSCTAPAVNAAGAVTCTVGTLAAGATGSFQVTVKVACGTTGTITAGNYQIAGTGILALLGSHVNTTVGCTADAQCPSGNWCDISQNECLPTLANGVQVPTDSSHLIPVLDGICNAGAGALVCTSMVCDTGNNECGYANGDGSCDAADGSVVCQSGVCDPDGKCGYANGDGTCTTGAQCRSTACSANGKCEPLGGCNVDADCASGLWCFESTHTCTATLANGTALPTDAPHTNPTLDGTCGTGVGALVCTSHVCDVGNMECGYANGDGMCTPGTNVAVCQSGVCDPDGKCGYANGDGTCTTGTQCRSSLCSANGECEAPGSCNVDADCTGGNWCDETMHTCTGKLSNGTAMPNDPPHTNPTLGGTCTAAAATLVCQTGVCDTKNSECGYANGDGPCSTGAGAVVCQSGTCSANAPVCIPATGGCAVDADCSSTQFCDTVTFSCTAKLPNSQAVPTLSGHTPPLTGTCTIAVGAAVCVSGVCDTNNNECGYANGDGPCTATNGATVCQSGMCGPNGTCQGSGSCNVDADCPAGDWCNETAHECTPKLPNGVAVPTDTAHMNPTLDGVCTAAAGTVVCKSGVCDTKDNKCGYANGDGPCTATDGTTDCRSTFCATTGPNGGLCVACTTSSECPAGTPVCSTTTNTCVQCTSSSMCDTDAPTCNTTTGMCISSDAGVGDGGSRCTKDNECPKGEFCGTTGACTPDLETGATCNRSAQCLSSECANDVCSTVVGSGSGLFCSVRAPGLRGTTGAGAVGLLLAMLGAAARRRRPTGESAR